MTPYAVAGFDRPASLYEFASNHGIHAGSMDKLMRFAIALQQAALDEQRRAIAAAKDQPQVEVSE